MSTQAATAPDAAPDPAPADAAARARAERHLVVLDQLMEAALRLALAIEQQVTQPEVDAPKAVEGDVALAFHRAARAVRMTVALQARLIEERRRPEGAAPAGEPRTLRVVLVETDGTERPLSGGRLEPEPAPHSKAEVHDVLRQVARAGLVPGELTPREAAETAERLAREGVERLETEREFEDIMRRPVSEIIDLICRDLGIAPDWPHLAEEAWALKEMASERVGAPLAPFRPPGQEKPEPRPPRPPDRWPDVARPRPSTGSG
jgi:hypothetical protein